MRAPPRAAAPLRRRCARGAVLLVAFLALGCLVLVRGAAHAAHQDDDVSPRDLTLCKAMLARFVPELKALRDVTIFCPTNDAFLEFSSDMGYGGDDPVAALLKGAAPYAGLYAQILKFHAVKGVRPAAALKVQNAATLKSGALSTLSGQPLKVSRDDGDLELVVPLVDPTSREVDDDNTDYVVGEDLTFEGPFAKSSKAYVVHAVERVLIPPAAAAQARRAYATIAKSSG